MAAIDFPNSPSVNDQFTAAGKTWVWTGTSWDAVGSGGGGTWGSITGTLSAQTDLYSALSAKEPTITAGTSSQYWRGDKTWQTFNLQNLTTIGNTTNQGIVLTNTGATKSVTVTVDTSGNILFSAGLDQNFHFSGDVVAFSSLTPPASTWWDSLPVASVSTLGGIKVGSGLQINGSGVLSVQNTVGHVIYDTAGSALTQQPKLKFERLTVTNDSVNTQTVVTRPSDTYVAVSPPSSPVSGDTWISSESLKAYVYYDSFWVEDGAAALNGVTQAYVDAKFATRYSRRSDYASGYAYCGTAANGSADSAAAWYITRIPINADGTTGTIQRAPSNSIWNNRTSLTYT